MTLSASSRSRGGSSSASGWYRQFAAKENNREKSQHRAGRPDCKCGKENPRVRERSAFRHRFLDPGRSNGPLGWEKSLPVRSWARSRSCDVLAGIPPFLPTAVRLREIEKLTSCCLWGGSI